MSTLTMTNVPPKLYKKLQQSARKSQRTLDEELLIREAFSEK